MKFKNTHDIIHKQQIKPHKLIGTINSIQNNKTLKSHTT